MGNAFLLIVVGLLLFYIVVSDKWKCVEGFAGCVSGRTGNGAQQTNISVAPVVPNTQPQINPVSFGLPDLALNSNWMAYGF